MTITELYSKKQKRLRADSSDVYIYDKVPIELRIQIFYICQDIFGDRNEYLRDSKFNRGSYTVYKNIVSILCREYGCETLVKNARQNSRDYFNELKEYFFKAENYERTLDIIGNN